MIEMKTKTINILMLIFGALMSATGQFLFKYAFSFSSYTLYLYLLVGVFFYILSTGIYFYVLSRTHLTWAYSIGGLSYVFAFIFANFIEQIPILRWIGLAIITVGVFLIGMS